MKAIDLARPAAWPAEYRAIADRIASASHALIVAELASATGQPKISTLHRLKQLELHGFVKLQRSGPQRAILPQLTAKGKAAIGMKHGINVYGTIAAGALQPPGIADVAEVLETLHDLFPNLKAGDFMLVVNGDSMFPEIWDGDRVLIRPGIEPEQGEITAVHVGEDAHATLKRFFRDDDGAVILRAANKAYPDIVIDSDTMESRIVGVFRGLVRLPKK